MDVRPAEGLAEFRAAMAVNVRAWRAAYEDVLPADVLADLSVPDDEALGERWEVQRQRDGTFQVAVDPDADAPDDVVGFAEIVWGQGTKAFVEPDEAELRAIYVEPAMWGEGIGTRLLERGLEAVPDDRTALKLEVFGDNDVGVSFYEARGFERVGESSFDVAGDAYPTLVFAMPL